MQCVSAMALNAVVYFQSHFRLKLNDDFDDMVGSL